MEHSKRKTTVIASTIRNITILSAFPGVAVMLLLGLGLGGCSNIRNSYNFSSAQGSAIHTLHPAIAVRAMGCVTCHATISSNIMTDFGYGDGSFFYNSATLPWNLGSAYGDHGAFNATTPSTAGGSWWTAVVSSSSTIYLPNAALPSYVQSQPSFNGTVHTLTDYLDFMLHLAGGGSSASPPLLKALSQIHIGAPVRTQILQAMSNAGSTGDFLYLKAQADSPALSGLSEPGAKTFVVDGNLTCDGELLLDGTLLLSNLLLNTSAGCHIYATQTVFISGPVSYTKSSGPQSNLQISSSRAISLGLGDYQASCDATEYNVLHTYVPADTDSVALRFKDMWTVPGYVTRDGIDPVVRGQDVVADGVAIRLYHPLQDAICEAQGRTVAYQRLLLNAPNIQSRYNGEFKGAIIAEVFIGALGSFQYIFDPVFSTVPILPLLPASTYLTGL